MAQDFDDDGDIPYSPPTANTHYTPPPSSTSGEPNGILRMIHIFIIINALLAFFFPILPLVLGVVVVFSLGSLEKDKVSEYHKANDTNHCCLVLCCLLSFFWSFMLGLLYALIFFFIIPIPFAIVCFAAAFGSLKMMG